MTMKVSVEKDLQALIKLIEDVYAGDYASVFLDLERAIYCLHLLAKDRLPERDIRNLCHSLQQLGDSFYEAHTDRRVREHKEYMELLEEAEANPRFD